MDMFARMAIPAAAFVIAGSALMLLAADAGSAEWTISLIAFGGGLVVVALSILLVRLGGRGVSPQQEDE